MDWALLGAVGFRSSDNPSTSRRPYTGGAAFTGTEPSGGTKPSTRPFHSTRSEACTAFCHFICGNHFADHCSRQPVVASTANKTEHARRPSLDTAHLIGPVGARQGVDLGRVARQPPRTHRQRSARHGLRSSACHWRESERRLALRPHSGVVLLAPQATSAATVSAYARKITAYSHWNRWLIQARSKRIDPKHSSGSCSTPGRVPSLHGCPICRSRPSSPC
jgi:hypothetical protein